MDTDDNNFRPHITSKKRWSRWKTRTMTKMQICDRWAKDLPLYSPLHHSWHGTVFGQRKRVRSAYICIDDGSIIGNKASKQAMHSGELG